ncbi:TIGR01777 family oxidoreductase [Nitratidesulfovibrio sp. SRB-5]|uniref:TIGR01777 family oxidoreductase n=1 Tax=Nitratidesulfovibrio sp. SRB-5 TaxID=2872636 RepID=UPI0010286641|nr:TIGR01777 family oxidoreductase [Nitratidesulfovibrio sp. SRB-5]MBZ2172385.1 TIGR01777 family oxidoreductase [Nitratidesulfovibrio sp. SRB-5]RXF76993.1 TIGR01777 family protein [Desulfovibrio sp. DS-1]
MHVAILGGTGFIGSALARALLARGDMVTVLSRAPRPAPAPGVVPAQGVVQAAWNGRDPESLARLLEGTQAVVNLLGENIAGGRWTPQRKTRIVDSRVAAGQAVAAALGAMNGAELPAVPPTVPPTVLVQASAVGYYGAWSDMAAAPLCAEGDPPGTGFLAETCARWEASSAPAQAMGVRRCIIRSGVVLGAGGALARMLPAFRAWLGGPLGSGRQPFPWIHLADEVGAILHLLDTPSCSGPYNLAAPQAVDNAGFTAELNRAVGRPAWLPAPPVPAFALRLALGELAEEALLAGQVTPPGRLADSGYTFRFPALRAALADLLAA